MPPFLVANDRASCTYNKWVFGSWLKTSRHNCARLAHLALLFFCSLGTQQLSPFTGILLQAFCPQFRISQQHNMQQLARTWYFLSVEVW